MMTLLAIAGAWYLGTRMERSKWTGQGILPRNKY